MMSIETLMPGGPVHWGVMLAQGWKGELANVDRAETWAVARDWARQAELMGFDGVWVFDHFQPYPTRDDSPVLEAWTTLAALSQVTDRVVIGTLVSCAGYRNAQVTVKMAENVSRLSGGRFCLGLGAGWDRPEFESLDIAFLTASERSDQLEVVLRGCRGAWHSPGGSEVGELDGSGRGPLLLVGGEGEKRTLPAAVAHANLVNWQVGVAEFRRKSRDLADLCETAGRDPASVRRTHAPNFQLFESEHEFALWRQSKDRGMSSEEVYAYIRNRGAFYGTDSAIEATVEEFLGAGCQGFVVYCNAAPSASGMQELASYLPYEDKSGTGPSASRSNG